jgi:hypothetical protein
MTAPPGYIQVRKRMVRLFRTRAVEALQNARLARNAGDIDGMRSCVVAMRYWRRLARAWARKTVLP